MFSRIVIYIILLICVFIPMFIKDTYAVELNLPNVSITPNNYIVYSLVRLSEKAIVFARFGKEAKVEYFKELTLKRLAELKYVVDNKLLGEVQQSSQRLSYQVGILSDFININRIELSEQLIITKDLLNSYKDLLSNLRDKYPANSSYWMLIQHDLNSIDINLEKLK